VRAPDLEGVARVGERRGGPADELVAPRGVERCEQAELVAAHPIDAPEAIRRPLQALGQAGQ
jgi:hypothetical protein